MIEANGMVVFDGRANNHDERFAVERAISSVLQCERCGASHGVVSIPGVDLPARSEWIGTQ
jgi:hypothetical protein